MKLLKNLTLSRVIIATCALSGPLLLSACGETRTDRALSGAGIGAAAGTVGGIITGVNPVTGVVIGGAVGAATGAVTDSDDVNLGKPIWNR